MFMLWTREAAKKRVGGMGQQESTEVSSVESAANYQRVMNETWDMIKRIMDQVERGARDIRELRAITKKEIV
jgi:hypothetical protein